MKCYKLNNFVVILFLFLILTGCKFNKVQVNQEGDKKDAVATINRFFDFEKEQKIDSAIMFFHPNIRASNDPSKMKDFLKNISLQSQSLTSRTLDHWNTNITIGLNASSLYSLYYVDHYNGGSVLKLSIKLSKDGEGKIKIVGFQIDPEKFM